jgi:hypothetical protein
MVGQHLEYTSGRTAKEIIIVLEHLADMKNFSLHGVMEDSWDKISG